MKLTEQQIEQARWRGKLLLARHGKARLDDWQRWAIMGFLKQTKARGSQPQPKSVKARIDLYEEHFDFSGDCEVIE